MIDLREINTAEQWTAYIEKLGRCYTKINPNTMCKTSLFGLNLSGQDLSDEQIILLAEALKTNKTIYRLNLENNNIGDRGVQALKELRKINTTLKRIDLKRGSVKLSV